MGLDFSPFEPVIKTTDIIRRTILRGACAMIRANVHARKSIQYMIKAILYLAT
jgi:hypothetical protein